MAGFDALNDTLVLHCILTLCDSKQQAIQTGTVYTNYAELAPSMGLRCLSSQRVSDILAELDTVGLIHSQLVSRGKFGRSREITVPLPDAVRAKAAEELKVALGC